MHRIGMTKWKLILVASLIKSYYDRDVINDTRRGWRGSSSLMTRLECRVVNSVVILG